MDVDIKYIFEKIYSEESDAIFRFTLIRVSDREQALDITQETFLRLWQTLSTNTKVLNSRAFLFTIAHRLIIDWYRKKKSLSLDKMVIDEIDRGSESDLLLDEKSLDGIELGAEGRYVLEQINKLSPGSRNPVYLRFVEGLSPKEIGGILGISANAASVRVNRGLLELRKKTGYDDAGKNQNNINE